MARQSTIKTHPQVELIERGIAEGVSAVELARRYGVSPSAIARHKSKRLDTLSQALDDTTPSPMTVLGRMADLTDSATRSRVLADATGTAAVRARAQTVELSALNTLIDRLGIDDLETARLAQGAGLMVKAISELLIEHPEILADAQRHIRAQHEDLADLADNLGMFIKRKTQ